MSEFFATRLTAGNVTSYCLAVLGFISTISHVLLFYLITLFFIGHSNCFLPRLDSDTIVLLKYLLGLDA